MHGLDLALIGQGRFNSRGAESAKAMRDTSLAKRQMPLDNIGRLDRQEDHKCISETLALKLVIVLGSCGRGCRSTTEGFTSGVKGL